MTEVRRDHPRVTLDRGASRPEAGSARLTYLDNLKVVLIATIIALHGILGYVGVVEAWTYSGVRETSLNEALQVLLLVLVSPVGFFFMALLFLVAGLLTPASYDRKGARRFTVDRLTRLGLPFAVYVFLVQPSLVYPLEHTFGDTSGSYWEEYLGEERQIDTGPLWFVGVLLVYSLAYAGWRAWGERREPGRASTQRWTESAISWRTLLVTTAVVAPASFAVRLVYPYASEAGVSDLNFWEWPACIALFVLGIVGARQGWLHAVPDDLARRCRALAVPALVAMAALLFIAGSRDELDHALGGLHWLAAAFALVEAVLVVLGSVWLLSVAQRRLHRQHRWGPALGRSAYAAFILQTPVLLGLAVLLRPVEVPAEVKALAVAVLGVVVSFGVAWLLIKKVPGVSRVL